MNEETIETDDELDHWTENFSNNWYAFAQSLDCYVWILYVSAGGDWYATRPAHEDDDPTHWNKGVTQSVYSLPLPLKVWSVDG